MYTYIIYIIYIYIYNLYLIHIIYPYISHKNIAASPGPGISGACHKASAEINVLAGSRGQLKIPEITSRKY